MEIFRELWKYVFEVEERVLTEEYRFLNHYHVCDNRNLEK